MLKIEKETREMANKDLNNLAQIEKDMANLKEIKKMISRLEDAAKVITKGYFEAMEEAKVDEVTTEVGTFQHAKTGIVTSYDYAKYFKDKGIEVSELADYTKTSTRKAHIKFIEKKEKGVK